MNGNGSQWTHESEVVPSASARTPTQRQHSVRLSWAYARCSRDGVFACLGKGGVCYGASMGAVTSTLQRVAEQVKLAEGTTLRITTGGAIYEDSKERRH